MENKISISTFCKAQAQSNEVDKEVDENRKVLNERIKTCRSLVYDNLISKKITCVEVYENESEDPTYVRLKPVISNVPITLEFLRTNIDLYKNDAISDLSEKYNGDFPKMMAANIYKHLKVNTKKNTGKTTLSISKSKERGYSQQPSNLIETDTVQMAKDLLVARKELSSLKATVTEKKKDIVRQQKNVEEEVKTILKNTDPKNMTQRVHMSNKDGDEWIYYLRCKEAKIPTTIGIRTVSEVVENSIANAMKKHKLTRHCQTLTPSVWQTVHEQLDAEFSKVLSQTKLKSTLSLDRGAPRPHKKQETNDTKSVFT